jgi:phosphatidylglycerophosphatase C
MKVRAAVFDLDGTIVRCDLYAQWIKRRFTAGAASFVRGLVRGSAVDRRVHIGDLRFRAKSYVTASCLRACRSQDQLNDETERFVAWALAEMMAPGARRAIERHRNAGDFMVLATGGLDLYAVPLGRALGFPEIIATRVDPFPGPMNTGLIGPNIRGDVKRDLVAAALKARGMELATHVVAYSDSATDFPLLDASAKGVLVNPSSRSRRAAQGKPYEIVEWGSETGAVKEL